MNKIFASAHIEARVALPALLAIPIALALAAGFWLASIPAGAQTSAAAGGGGKALLNLFFIAKRESSLEPCGCHTEQRGGIAYEGTIYNQHTDLPGIRLDAGQWAIDGVSGVPLEAMKTRYLLRGMARLKMDAINIAWSDAELSPDFYETVGKAAPEATANLTSANIFRKDDPAKTYFPAYRIIERQVAGGKTLHIGIVGATHGRPTGVMAPVGMNGKMPGPLESPYYTIKPAEEALSPVIAELRPKVDLLVVMYDGDLKASTALAHQFQSVDYLISGGIELGPNLMATREGKVEILAPLNTQGREVGFAPLTLGAAGRWEYAAPPRSVFVTLDLPTDPAESTLIDEFKKETKTLDVKVPSNVKRIYAGASQCMNCHQAEYLDWQNTKHAHALSSLINKSQESNPECLKCHTVGFRNENGFYSITLAASTPYANVQCENCHGPSYDHYLNETMLVSGKFWMKKDQLDQIAAKVKETLPAKVVPETTCIQCHTMENDGKFVYSAKEPKIDHHEATAKAKAAMAGQPAMPGATAGASTGAGPGAAAGASSGTMTPQGIQVIQPPAAQATPAPPGTRDNPLVITPMPAAGSITPPAPTPTPTSK